MSLVLDGITKRFGTFTAVDDVSFTVPEGGTFGFMGSNGAGKTTTMRMILRILLPDAGQVSWQGHAPTDTDVHSFGYLPEERGLYPKMRVGDQLAYLATLHGLTRPDARRSVAGWLERLEIGAYRDKRIDQLSKGNQQKVQFVAAVAHRPRLIILDEPFSGLDPVNVQVLQNSVRHLQQQGATLIFSSHRLDTVEDLCTDVALIHQARLLLAGSLRRIKQQSGHRNISLSLDGSLDFLDRMPGLTVLKRTPEGVELRVQAPAEPQQVLRTALEHGAVRHFTLGEPSLEEIYLETVKGATA